MVQPSVIEARLGELGFTHSRWFRAEIHELKHILMDDEQIISLACGRYFGSFALLVATDQRLLLIDKRVFFMTLEDTRYDMISEIDYNSQVYNATVTIYTMNKTHKFSSVKFKRQLRELTTYVQRRVMEFRQQQPAASSSIGQPQIRFIPSSTQSPALQPYQPVHSQTLQLPASSPNDYYVDYSHGGGHIKDHVGHVAHLVGSAATKAAHHHVQVFSPMPFRPYVQGSLMTRRPIAEPPSY